VVAANSLENSFANCGTRATTVTLTVVYWYATLGISKYKEGNSFQEKVKHNPHIFANTQHCWQHYVIHPRCQTVFPMSGFLFKKILLL